MYQIFWDFWPYESNPQYKSFENRSINWIHETNLFNTVGQNKSKKQILWKQYEFANPKPRICMGLGLFKVHLCTKDLSGFVRIRWIRENRSNLCNSGHKWNPRIQIFKVQTCKSMNLDLSITIWIKPYWSQDSWPWYKTNPWIWKTNPCFTNLLIDSHNLKNFSCKE
jgi:hypothetical protein